jgi:dTDP-4-amino-4,6-dideoxygalactose transaminase
MNVMQSTKSTGEIHFGRPMIGAEERAIVMDVLAGPVLAHGPRGKQFEADFAAWTGAPEAISVSNCTAGLHLVWFALGIGPGDEVIVPSVTHTASAHAVELTGARAVFADIERTTGNIDPAAVEAAITPRTRGICVVHFLGLPADMTRINAIARKRSLFVLEDCALAVGTKLDGVHAGVLGDAGVFSFYPVKHMTTAEGGMIITRDADLARKLRLAKAFGVDRSVEERTVPGIYDVVSLGFNYRMNEMAAALGIVQLKRMDDFLAKRKVNAAALDTALGRIEGLHRLDGGDAARRHSHYCTSVVLPDDIASRRGDVALAMKAQAVGTSVYYPGPLPHLTYYREKYGFRRGQFPVGEWFSAATLALPCAPHLDEADMARVGMALERSIKEVRL